MNEYKYLIVPISTLIICQLLKFIIESIKEKRVVVERLFNGSGGIPSSHTALSTSLAVMFIMHEGVTSPYAAIMIVVTMIVAYDGMNVRMETGRHAKMLNDYVKKNNIENYGVLKEELGHRPKEVLVGIILGIIMPLLYQLFL